VHWDYLSQGGHEHWGELSKGGVVQGRFKVISEEVSRAGNNRYRGFPRGRGGGGVHYEEISWTGNNRYRGFPNLYMLAAQREETLRGGRRVM
jgi:hypothetical protein